jgi:hypothetical protein
VETCFAIGWNVSNVQRFSLGAWKYNVHVPEGRGESILTDICDVGVINGILPQF